MDKWSLLTAFVCLILATQWPSCHGGATVEQMAKSMTMIRGVCLPKTKITDDMADGIRQGNFLDEKPFKCYIHCCLEMTGMMKKNKVNYEATLKQIDMLMPEDMKAPYKSSLANCKDSAVGIKDSCDAAVVFVKCMFKEYPDMMFP